MPHPKPFQEWKRWRERWLCSPPPYSPRPATPTSPARRPPPRPALAHGHLPAPSSSPRPRPCPAASPNCSSARCPSTCPDTNRDDWRHWVDDDGDCQNARHETLVAESRIAVTFTDEDRCTVATGEWLDPYTGDILTSARDLDVDHMVPLANAHRSGAWDWDAARRLAYANDLTYANHLIVVTSSVNRAKSDSGPEEWRPPDASYWCQYAIDWAAIKADWGLSATPAEWDALLEMAATCGGDFPPTPTPPPTATLAPGATTYASCDEAERAGLPRQQGSQGSGYGFPAETVPSARDGDGDGVVCERTGAAAPTSAAASTPAPTPTPAETSTVYGSCEEAEQAGVPRQQGSQGSGYGFSAETVPSARDGDNDGVVCERPSAAAPTSAAATTPTPAPTPAEASTVYASCEEAEQAGIPRQQGSSGGGRGFPADLVPTARDGDGDGVVCER